jgi:hypothetical protein
MTGTASTTPAQRANIGSPWYHRHRVATDGGHGPTDDNFASIVAAIEQGGSSIPTSVFIYFLLACNVGEILIILGAMLVGMPIPPGGAALAESCQ